MITYIRTSTMAPGTWAQALTQAHDVAKHLSTLLGVEMHVSVPIGGDPNQIAWSAQYESLAALETAYNKMMADAKYREMSAKGAGLFMPATTRDAIWRRT